MAFPLELIHTVLGVGWHLSGNAQAQCPVDIKKEVFFPHGFPALSFQDKINSMLSYYITELS
jgi:hypothetical protein